MALFLATVFLTFALITLVSALPTNRVTREVTPSSTPAPISVTQTRAGNLNLITFTVNSHQCMPVDPKIPSTMKITTGEHAEYELIGYSAPGCGDTDTVVVEQTLVVNQPLEVNERQPVCSFKLEKKPLGIAPVTVSFNHNDNIDVRENIQDLRCHDLCNGSVQARYPYSVRILETDGLRAHNSVFLSERSCEQETWTEDNFMRVSNDNGTDLVGMTRRNPAKIVRSFLIRPKV